MKKDDFLRKIEKPWTMAGCVYSFLRRVTESYYVFEQVTPSGGLHYELVEPVRSGNGGRYPVSEEWGAHGHTFSGSEANMWAHIRRLVRAEKAVGRVRALPESMRYPDIPVLGIPDEYK